MVFNSTAAHVTLHTHDLPVFLSAASTSTVVQFSFATSSGFIGVPPANWTGAAPDECWLQHDDRRRPYQRFLTLVNMLSIAFPTSGSSADIRRGLSVTLHLAFSKETAAAGTVLRLGCENRGSPVECVAENSITLPWDFELLELVQQATCAPPSCANVSIVAAASTEAMATAACKSYQARRSVRAMTKLGEHLLSSEFVGKCIERLHVAAASMVGCVLSDAISWAPVRGLFSDWINHSITLDDLWSQAREYPPYQVRFTIAGPDLASCRPADAQRADSATSIGALSYEAALIFAMKTPNGIIASERLQLILTSQGGNVTYTEVLPAACLHGSGVYLLYIELPLPFDSNQVPDHTAEAQSNSSEARPLVLRIYFDGVLIHAAPFQHAYLQITGLRPGTHELELRLVDEASRPIVNGFHRRLHVNVSSAAVDSELCDFSNPEEDTVLLSAAGLPSVEEARLTASPDSRAIIMARPVEGDCFPTTGPLRLSLEYPSSVQSSRQTDMRLLISVDGSAVQIVLNTSSPVNCFEIDRENVENNRPRLTPEHMLKVAVVTSDWQVVAESLTVVVFEQIAHPPSWYRGCRVRTPPESDDSCVHVAFPREPSAELIASIQRNPRRPACRPGEHIDGVWANGTFFPFFCTIPVLGVEAARACMQNRSIIIGGNSVMRGLFLRLRNRFLDEAVIDDQSPVILQRSASGKLVDSNWWHRRAEMTVCPKTPGSFQGMAAKCRSRCWSCMEEVGGGRVAYVWIKAIDRSAPSDRWASIIRCSRDSARMPSDTHELQTP